MPKRWMFPVILVVLAVFSVGSIDFAVRLLRNPAASMIHHVPTTLMDRWVLANLAGRLLAVAIGGLLAVASRNRAAVAVMLVVRVIADGIDLVNTLLTTPNTLPVATPFALSGFIVVQVAALTWLGYDDRRTEGTRHA